MLKWIKWGSSQAGEITRGEVVEGQAYAILAELHKEYTF